MWEKLDELALLKILDKLNLQDIGSSARVCTQWNFISRNDLFWKKRLVQDFNLPSGIALPPGSDSWQSEYRRLFWETPCFLHEELQDHGHEVTHAAFSPGGTFLATVGNDCMVFLYRADELYIKYVAEKSLSSLGWQSIEQCAFSPDGDQLLVSGTHAPDILKRVLGEIVVFDVQRDLQTVSKISTKPNDAGGCWLSDGFVVSSDFKWLANMISASALFVNKVGDGSGGSQFVESQDLLSVYNPGGSAVRHMLACEAKANLSAPRPKQIDEVMAKSAKEKYRELRLREFAINGKVPALPKTISDRYIDLMRDRRYSIDPEEEEDCEECEGFIYQPQYYSVRQKSFVLSEQEESSSSSDSDTSSDCSSNCVTDCPTYLIFSTGSRTSAPHQVGIIKMDELDFKTEGGNEQTLEELIDERKQRNRDESERLSNMQESDLINWADYASVRHLFHPIDLVFEAHGRVTGLGVSPDERHLYVCYHPWQRGYQYIARGSGDQPPVVDSIDCCVVDLATLDVVGTLRSKPCSFTSNRSVTADCSPSVGRQLVAMGGWGDEGMLYDRHFGVRLGVFKHDERVNCVALRPGLEDIAVSVANDMTVKVWRSRKELKRAQQEK